MNPRPAIRRLLRMQLGERSFALDLAAVAGIEAGDALAEASWSGDLIGSLIHNGEEINVHLLAPRLGLPMFSGAKTRGAVVVVRTARPTWGMLCDRVIADTHSAPVLHAVPGPCGPLATLPFRGVAEYPGEAASELAWIVDPDRLHPDDPPLGPIRPSAAPQRATPPSAFAAPPGRDDSPAGERRGQVLMYPLGDYDGAPVSAGLSYKQVLEVLPMPALTPAPFAPPHVLGVCPWRGHVLAVVDLARRFGLPAGPARKLVVARPDPQGELIGLAAPAQLSPLRLPAPHGPADAAPAGPALGAFALADRTLLLPDLGALAAAL